MYIVGRKAQQGTSAEVLNQCGCIYDSPAPSDEEIVNNMVDIYGGTSADYAVLDYGNTETEETNRIFKEDAVYDLNWTDTSAISGVNFDRYDTWKQIDVSATKYKVTADNVDSTQVTFTIYNSDGETVDTSFTSSFDLDIYEIEGDNGQRVLLNLNITNGTRTILIKNNSPISFGFPSRRYTDRKNNLKIKNRIRIDVV